MQRVLVDGDGDDSEVDALVFDSYAMRPPPSYSVATVEERDNATHCFEVLGIYVF